MDRTQTHDALSEAGADSGSPSPRADRVFEPKGSSGKELLDLLTGGKRPLSGELVVRENDQLGDHPLVVDRGEPKKLDGDDKLVGIFGDDFRIEEVIQVEWIIVGMLAVIAAAAAVSWWRKKSYFDYPQELRNLGASNAFYRAGGRKYD
jgi:hypothetical protein